MGRHIKSKQEIGAEAKSKAPHISAQQLADDLASGKEFILLVRDIGYTNVVDLAGGFEGWVAEDRTFYNTYGELRLVSGREKE